MRAGSSSWILVPVVVIAAMTSCTTPQRGSPTFEDVFQFNSLEEMAAGSDLVIDARIVASEPAREVGPVRFTDLQLDVLETLKGNAGDRVVVEVVDLLPLEPGDAGFFFLQRQVSQTDRTVYILSNSESVFLVREGDVAPIDATRSWISEIASSSPEELRTDIQNAIDADVPAPSPQF